MTLVNENDTKVEAGIQVSDAKADLLNEASKGQTIPERLQEIQSSSDRKSQLAKRISLGDGLTKVLLVGAFVIFWVWAAFKYFM